MEITKAFTQKVFNEYKKRSDNIYLCWSSKTFEIANDLYKTLLPDLQMLAKVMQDEGALSKDIVIKNGWPFLFKDGDISKRDARAQRLEFLEALLKSDLIS